MDGTAEMILDFEQKYINGQLSIAEKFNPYHRIIVEK